MDRRCDEAHHGHQHAGGGHGEAGATEGETHHAGPAKEGLHGQRPQSPAQRNHRVCPPLTNVLRPFIYFFSMQKIPMSLMVRV